MKNILVCILSLFVIWCVNTTLAEEKPKDPETEKKLARLKELADQMDKLARQIESERQEERELGQQIRLGYEPITNYYAIAIAKNEKAGKLVEKLYQLEKEILNVREELKAIVEALPEYQEHQKKMKAMADRISEIVQNRSKLIAERNKISAEYFRLRSELGTLPSAPSSTSPVTPNSSSSAGISATGMTYLAIPKPETPCITCEENKKKMMEQSKKIGEQSKK